MKLPLGQIEISDFARRALAEADQDVEQFLARHQRGDWGEVDATGKAHNDHAATHDLDVTSYYRLTTGVILTITTEYDRAVTCVELLSGT
ncbi:MAG: hypothetical protein M3439_08205 [Chloroflexota bacterium]|nr:hypothetical protein [Chloroflexota bacterium]